MVTKVYPHMLAWREDPANPDRPLLSNPHVQRLLAAIAPGSTATDLGGVMSLNVGLQPDGLVLRVHQPFVSRPRLRAEQEVRRRLVDAGLNVPVPLAWNGSTMIRCGTRWAALEAYLPHERITPSPESYAWIFRAMGTLHRPLAALDLHVPQPAYAVYGPPSTLRRWLPIIENAVRDDPEASRMARWLRELIGQLRRQWIPATEVPVQLVHGDISKSNVCRAPAGPPVYFDFGFLARRPRVYEVAYAIAKMVITFDGHMAPERFAWEIVPPLVEAYESAAGVRLTGSERKALAPYVASYSLFQTCTAGFSNDPVASLKESRPDMQLSEWLLAHPDAVQC